MFLGRGTRANVDRARTSYGSMPRPYVASVEKINFIFGTARTFRLSCFHKAIRTNFPYMVITKCFWSLGILTPCWNERFVRITGKSWYLSLIFALLFRLLQDGSNNNGYVPYVDYTRDYMPPTTQGVGASRESLSRIPSGGILASKKIGLSSANLGSSTPQTTPAIDPRFSATYGNPYLR